MTIYKYETTDISRKFSLYMPLDAQILIGNFQEQGFCVWALVDPAKESKQKYFKLYATGEEFNISSDKLIYINTVFVQTFVFHLFEVI